MKIDYIKTKGFRSHEEIFETDLYDITNITGKNRSGKSNILYAIINIVLGTNLSGDEKQCLINKKCDTSYGELHFTDNTGMKHTIIRSKNRFDNKGNMLLLDGKPVTQTELVSFYKDKKLFLSIINPLYFLSKKPADQKELVDKYLSDIKPKEIFDRLSKEEQNLLLEKYYKEQDKTFDELTEDEQTRFVNINMYNICMDIAYNNLEIEERNLLEGMPSDIPTYVNDFNKEIKRAEATIATIDGKIEYADKFITDELPKKKSFEKEEELTLASQELSFLSTNQDIENKEKQKQLIERMEKDILAKENEFSDLENKMKKGKQVYLSIKSGACSKCPTCEQQIADENKMVTIQNMKKELEGYFDRSNLLKTMISDLKSSFTIERCKFHALEGDSTVEKTKRIAVVKEDIKRLENEKLQIEKYNGQIDMQIKQMESARNDIIKFKKEKKAQSDIIDNLNKAKKVAQKLYIAYIEEKMKLAREYLKDVNIKFYSVLKTTGEIKEDFIIEYKNHPLSDLSRSETIATALEFANMFNKISKVNVPIFIDDYESCADYDFIKDYAKDTQLIIARVSKGESLKIADGNSSKFTVIETELNKEAELQAA